MTCKTLTELMCDRAQQQPEALFVRFVQRGDAVEHYTYGQTWEWATRWARLFLDRGVQRGQPVALALPNSPDFIGAFFGALLAGAVPAPLPPFQRVKAKDPYLTTVAGRLKFISAPVLVLPTEQVGLADLAPLSTLENLTFVSQCDVPEDAQPLAPQGSEDELGLLQFTSGTSGGAKAVQLSHKALLAQMRYIAERLELVHHVDRPTSWLPLFHDMGLIGYVLTPAYIRSSMTLLRPEDFILRPPLWLKALSDYGDTVTGGPPSAYTLCTRRIKDSDVEQYDLSRLRIALVGAEMVTEESLRQFTAKFRPAGLQPTSMMPTYGLAENGLAVAMPPPNLGPEYDTVDLDRLHKQGVAEPIEGDQPGRTARVFASVGRPLSKMDVAIVDEEGRPLAERHVGEITVHSPSLMKGYFQQPEATRQALRDGWLWTGDLGYLAGGRLFVTGRKKEVLIVGGRNYYPDDLEQVAGAVPGVRLGRSVAISYEDPQRASEAVVVLAETALTKPDERAELRQAIRRALVGAGMPISDVVLLRPRTINVTRNGKLRRNEVKERYLAGDFDG